MKLTKEQIIEIKEITNALINRIKPDSFKNENHLNAILMMTGLSVVGIIFRKCCETLNEGKEFKLTLLEACTVMDLMASFIYFLETNGKAEKAKICKETMAILEKEHNIKKMLQENQESENLESEFNKLFEKAFSC